MRSSEEAAFLELIASHQGIIHKVCSMYAQSGEDHADLFQEILLQLWRAYGSYAGKARLSTWMYRVALNTAISRFRYQSRRPQGDSLEASPLLQNLPAPAPDADMDEQRRFLHRAIGRLSQVERAIVMLYLEEHSYEEIADILGISSNLVGVKLNRIKGKLRKMLEPHFQ